jgi:hypothetical protein
MMKNNGRSKKGKRCYKTIHTYPFIKFNFICVIKCGKVIGYTLYKKIQKALKVINFVNFIINLLRININSQKFIKIKIRHLKYAKL